MTVKNPSFEDEGSPLGVPAEWDVEDLTAHVEVAEFGPLLGFERFERDWRLPFGLSLTNGNLIDPTIWASILNGAATLGSPPAADAVINPAVTVLSGTVPGGSVLVTITYTNENGDVGRTGNVVLPEGLASGTEYPFLLEDDDLGFQEITGLTTSSALPSTELGVVGSWWLAPRNEGAKFAFDDSPGVDLFPFSIDGNPHEGFEAGWSNDGGFRNNFEALNTAVAVFDTEEFEDFEDGWKLPITPYVSPFNEELRVAHQNWIDNEPVTVAPFTFGLELEINDRIGIEFLQAGTDGPLNIQLDPGDYSPAAMAAEIQSKVGAALDVDSGDATSADFSAIALSDGRIRLITTYTVAGPTRGVMRLTDPPEDSAWEELQFITGEFSDRSDEAESLETAAFSPEDFESDWKNNQAFVSSLPDDANGVIDAAGFGGPAPNTPETFETGWVLTLPP